MGNFTKATKEKLKAKSTFIKFNSAQHKTFELLIAGVTQADAILKGRRENFETYMIGLGLDREKVSTMKLTKDGLEITYK